MVKELRMSQIQSKDPEPKNILFEILTIKIKNMYFCPMYKICNFNFNPYSLTYFSVLYTYGNRNILLECKSNFICLILFSINNY